jgi:hypothetical protein
MQKIKQSRKWDYKTDRERVNYMFSGAGYIPAHGIYTHKNIKGAKENVLSKMRKRN